MLSMVSISRSGRRRLGRSARGAYICQYSPTISRSVFSKRLKHWHLKRSLTTLVDINILTTNLATCVCQCAKFDQFMSGRSHFGSKRPENCVRITKFPYAAFGPLFAFHCPLFCTRNNDLECKSSRFAAVDRRFVADKQLHLNGVIHSAGVAQCQELSAKM